MTIFLPMKMILFSRYEDVLSRDFFEYIIENLSKYSGEDFLLFTYVIILNSSVNTNPILEFSRI